MEKEELKAALIEHINNMPFDMLEDFTDVQIADTCISLAKCLEMYKTNVARAFMRSKDGVNHYIKVINKHGGSVSVSTCDCTGVSRTAYYPYYKNKYQSVDGLLNLADMINEAWYLSNQ